MSVFHRCRTASLLRARRSLCRASPRAAEGDKRIVVGAADPTRPQFEVRGTLILDNEYATASGAGTRNGTTPAMMAPQNTLTLEVSEIRGPNRMPKAGDFIRAIERPGTPEYRITSVDPLGTTDFQFVLVKAAQ